MKTEFRNMKSGDIDSGNIAASDTTASGIAVAGIFVEYRDCLGNTLGQAVYFDWRTHPLPNVGDSFACLATSPTGADRRKLHGRVISRHFDVQLAEDGAEQVWVRLEVEVASSFAVKRSHIAFSDN